MALQACRECSQQVSSEATTCPHCGVPRPAGGGPSFSSTTKPERVTLTDIAIPYWDLVGFILKWVFASIPVALMFLVIYLFLGRILGL
jgi:hypothetical protein